MENIQLSNYIVANIRFVYVNHIISNMHVMCNVRKTIEMEDSLLCHSRIRTNNLTDGVQVKRYSY